jgi:SNF2 family DNA or RNA helicase
VTVFTPWPHQQLTALACAQTATVFDMSDPGTGKTAAHLQAFTMRRAAGEATRLLVVCPKTLMRSAWGDEIDRYFPQLSYAIADAGNREAAFKFNTDVVIVNVDGVKDLAKKPALLKGFSDLIVDEATAYKHASSQRSKAMKRLSGMFINKYLLTGTPNANSVTELWHPMLLLDGGKRLGPSFYQFRNAVQVAEQVGPMPNMVKWHDKPEALEAVFSLIRDVTIRHSFEAVMSHVPANHVSRYDFDLKPTLMKQYKALEASCVLALKDGTCTAVHAAALRTKLLQMASGAVYTEEGKYSVLDTQRYELGADLIEQYEHSIVFFNWTHQRNQMEEMLKKRDISFAVIDGSVPQKARDQIVSDFQAGRYKTILLHPQTGAHGLTLTRGEACILLSPIYEADLLKQAIHRIYRGAQDKVTNTILIQARNTVEDLVYERRHAKTQNMNDFLGLVVQAQGRRS